VTPWGTWIEFCRFVFLNVEGIIEFASCIKDDDCSLVFFLIRSLEEENPRGELSAIYDLQMIAKTVKGLERRNLPVQTQKALLDEVQSCIPERLKLKLRSSLSKNPSFEEIIRLSNEDTRYQFAPLTSVDVERCFSKEKHILTSSRQSLTVENFRRLSICYINAKSILELSEDIKELE